MTLIAWLAGGYLALVGIAALGQRAMIYPAPTRGGHPSLPNGRLIELAAEDGETVYAYFVPATPGAPTVVHFHGNGEELTDGEWLMSQLVERGLGVFAIEYPGYGLAGRSSTTESRIYAHSDAALRRLTGELAVPPARIVLLGQSLGSGVAVEMSTRGHAARMVLVSPFTSMVDMARRVAPIFPANLIVRDRFESAAKAGRVAIPVLVIHGEQDDLVPAEMGRRLSTLLPKAELMIVARAGHNDVYGHGGDVLFDRIERFARGLDTGPTSR